MKCYLPPEIVLEAEALIWCSLLKHLFGYYLLREIPKNEGERQKLMGLYY